MEEDSKQIPVGLAKSDDGKQEATREGVLMALFPCVLPRGQRLQASHTVTSEHSPSQIHHDARALPPNEDQSEY